MRGGAIAACLLALMAGGAGAAAPRRECDDFRHGLSRWLVQDEGGAHVMAHGGSLDVDAPRGITLWYRQSLTGPVAIEYEVKPVQAGGPQDAVSDVNAFWMATDPAVAGGSALARPRSGAFADYDDLTTYYVGIGGNRNTTTRFRRYVGQPGNRPLLPQHDRSDAGAMLVPNRWIHLRLIADGRRIAVERDGAMLFGYDDPQPYGHGHFGLRTTKSHLLVRRLCITALSH